jgi:hypothetical protein
MHLHVTHASWGSNFGTLLFLFDDRTIMSTASSNIDLIIASDLPADVAHWKRAHVQTFLDANKHAYDLDGEDIEIIKQNKVAGVALLELTVEQLQNIGLALGPATAIAKLVEKLKKAKGLIELGECLAFQLRLLEPSSNSFHPSLL